MLRFIIITLTCLGLLAACLTGITLSVPLQSPALIGLGVAALLGAGLALRAQVSMKMLVLVLLAIVYLIVRALTSPVADLAIEDLFLILGASITYLLLALVINSPRARMASAWVMMLLLALHLGSVVMQLMGGEGYSLVRLFTHGIRPNGNVITGMYGYRGSFANFAAIVGMLSLSLGIWGRFSLIARVLLVLLGIAGLVATCMAQSRSAVIAMVIGGLVMMVLLWLSVAGQKDKVKTRFRAAVVGLGCVAVLVAVIGGIWVFQSRALQAEGSDVMFDSQVRLAYWPMAVEQWADYPVTGAGSRSYSYLCFQYWSPNLDSGEANPEFVHNEYLQLLADYGLLGFVLVTGLLLMHLVLGGMRVRKLAGMVPDDGLRQGSNAMALAIAGVTGIVIMAVHVIFDFRTHLLANLLLLVCCATWVLPVVKSKSRGVLKSGNLEVGESGSQGVLEVRLGSWCLVLVLLALGVGAIGLGGWQLKGGWPLMKQKMATETGAWYPSAARLEMEIPALEASLAIAPSYRRHLKLGSLYQQQAYLQKTEEQRNDLLEQALQQYELAGQRHPYDPVAVLNQALLHTYFNDYPRAEELFQRSDNMAASRERWFRIRTKWADMHRQWAGSLWKNGDIPAAAEHYKKAIEILNGGSMHSSDTVNLRRMIVIEHARMLDSLKRYEEAGKLFEDLEANLKVYQINSRAQNIRREMGEHYLRHAKHLWYSRKPEAAHNVLLKAKRSYQIHRVVLKGKPDQQAEKGFDEVKKILKFFKDTGVGGGE